VPGVWQADDAAAARALPPRRAWLAACVKAPLRRVLSYAANSAVTALFVLTCRQDSHEFCRSSHTLSRLITAMAASMPRARLRQAAGVMRRQRYKEGAVRLLRALRGAARLC